MGTCCIRTKEKEESIEKNRDAIIQHIKAHSNKIVTQVPESSSDGGQSPNQCFSLQRTPRSSREQKENVSNAQYLKPTQLDDLKAVRKEALGKTYQLDNNEDQNDQVLEVICPRRVRSERDLQGEYGQIEEICGEETEMASPLVETHSKNINNRAEKQGVILNEGEIDNKKELILLAQKQEKNNTDKEQTNNNGDKLNQQIEQEQVLNKVDNPATEEQDEFSKLLSERLRQDLMLNNEQYRKSTRDGSININSSHSSAHSSQPTSKPPSRPISPKKTQESGSDNMIPQASFPPVQLRKESSSSSKRQDAHEIDETVRKFERKKLLKQFSQNMVGHIYIHSPINTPRGLASSLNNPSHTFSSQGIQGYHTPNGSEQNSLRKSWANAQSANPPSKMMGLRSSYHPPVRYASEEIEDLVVPNSISIPEEVFEDVKNNQNKIV